jgi:hypothetical protein
VAKYKPKEVIIKTSLALNNVKSGDSDHRNDTRANTVNRHSNLFRLAVIIVLFQNRQTRIVDIPQTENLTNVTTNFGSTAPKACTPNTPEKKLKPKMIKAFSANLRDLLTTVCLYMKFSFSFLIPVT